MNMDSNSAAIKSYILTLEEAHQHLKDAARQGDRSAILKLAVKKLNAFNSDADYLCREKDYQILRDVAELISPLAKAQDRFAMRILIGIADVMLAYGVRENKEEEANRTLVNSSIEMFESYIRLPDIDIAGALQMYHRILINICEANVLVRDWCDQEREDPSVEWSYHVPHYDCNVLLDIGDAIAKKIELAGFDRAAYSANPNEYVRQFLQSHPDCTQPIDALAHCGGCIDVLKADEREYDRLSARADTRRAELQLAEDNAKHQEAMHEYIEAFLKSHPWFVPGKAGPDLDEFKAGQDRINEYWNNVKNESRVRIDSKDVDKCEACEISNRHWWVDVTWPIANKSWEYQYQLYDSHDKSVELLDYEQGCDILAKANALKASDVLKDLDLSAAVANIPQETLNALMAELKWIDEGKYDERPSYPAIKIQSEHKRDDDDEEEDIVEDEEFDDDDAEIIVRLQNRRLVDQSSECVEREILDKVADRMVEKTKMALRVFDWGNFGDYEQATAWYTDSGDGIWARLEKAKIMEFHDKLHDFGAKRYAIGGW